MARNPSNVEGESPFSRSIHRSGPANVCSAAGGVTARSVRASGNGDPFTGPNVNLEYPPPVTPSTIGPINGKRPYWDTRSSKTPKP